MASLPRSIPERGVLQEIPLPRILIELYVAGFDGSLQLTRDNVEKEIGLRSGAPVTSESNLASESLGIQLIDSGKLSRVDYAKVTSYVEQKQCKEGVALLALKLLTPKELFETLREQLRRRILDCFGWSEGRYQLVVEDSGSDEIHPFRNDPYRLVRDGLLAHWSPDRMLSELAAPLEQFPRPTEAAGEIVRRLQLDSEPSELLTGLSGKQSLGQALAPFLSSPATLAAVWVLDAAHVFSYGDRDTAEAEDAPEAHDVDVDIQIEVRGAESTDAEQRNAGTRPAPRPPEPAANGDRSHAESATASPKAQKLREEILQKLEQIDALDHYALLDVVPDAGPAAIRKAYFSAAKRYHPDTLARLHLEDITEQAAKVFARMAEANEVLSDKNKRAEYDAFRGSDELDVDVEKLARAETLYRKGDILMGMGDFKGALEYLRTAVELWPEEAAYQSALGWAYYKKAPSEPGQAAVHLRKALELAPNDSVSNFRLGLVERALT
jgi:hypothetical protein